MNYIKNYKLFESDTLSEYDDLMGQILHLYGSIPLPKEKSSVVINKIIKSSDNNFDLGDDVEINFYKTHDKVRFADYYNSLLQSKDSRGHNFEGLVAGLFDGTLTTRGTKADVDIEGNKWSVKFIDTPSKAPELGSYRDVIERSDINKYVVELKGLTNIFKKNNDIIIDDELNMTVGQLKEDIWRRISIGVDGWLIAYPESGDIAYSIISLDDMKSMLMDGMVAAPKAGYKSLYTLALSAKFKTRVEKYFIRIPVVTLKDLKNMKSSKDTKWAVDVFGTIAYKMRPDVILSIRKNKKDIIKRLKDIK